MRIAVADDSYLFRERIINMLRRFNEIEIAGEAANGAEALKILEEDSPEWIVLDIKMAEMSGIEVLNKIKEEKIKTKVIILTNYNYPQYKKKCIEGGAKYFFSKSEVFEKLPKTISKIIKETMEQ